jgi:hypothetical protein
MDTSFHPDQFKPETVSDETRLMNAALARRLAGGVHGFTAFPGKLAAEANERNDRFMAEIAALAWHRAQHATQRTASQTCPRTTCS